MATAIEVKLVLQKTIDGVENMKVVNDNVLAVDDRMRGMADGERSADVHLASHQRHL
jgi:hypothetical protein